MNRNFVGVDLGQSRDYSTIAVIERAELRGEYDYAWRAWRKEIAYRLRMLSRIPLGTPYPDVVRRIVQVTEAKELGGESHLIVDATGVGRPVIDLLREERPPATLLPVLVSGAAQETTSDGFYLVPKRDLIVGLQVLFQQGRLQMARDLEHANDFVEELLGMEVKVTLAGREVFGAWREGRHDDLVFAVALACWGLRRSYPHRLSGENQWWANRYEAEAADVFRKEMKRMEGDDSVPRR
jgi:hypothetical protein